VASLDESKPWFASEEFLDLLDLDLMLPGKLLDDVFEPEEAVDLQPDTILPDLISHVESEDNGACMPRPLRPFCGRLDETRALGWRCDPKGLRKHESMTRRRDDSHVRSG